MYPHELKGTSLKISVQSGYVKQHTFGSMLSSRQFSSTLRFQWESSLSHLSPETVRLNFVFVITRLFLSLTLRRYSVCIYIFDPCHIVKNLHEYGHWKLSFHCIGFIQVLSSFYKNKLILASTSSWLIEANVEIKCT